jgi:hypothetical protein
MTKPTTNWCLTVLCLAAALAMAACAGAKPGRARPPNEAPNVPDVAGTAKVYILNTTESWFGNDKSTIFDYQQPVVSVSDGRYSVIYLAPGRHAIGCAGMVVPPTVFDAVAGQTYYLQTYTDKRRTKQICGFLPPDLGEKVLAEFTEPPEEPQYWGMGGKK